MAAKAVVDSILVGKVRANAGQVSLESPWAPLHLLNGLEEKRQWLDHPDVTLGWVVRLLGDKGKVSDELARAMEAMAETEKDASLVQLAAAAKLPSGRVCLLQLAEATQSRGTSVCHL